MYVELIVAELEDASTKPRLFSAALSDACVELYLARTDVDNPAGVIFHACEDIGQSEALFQWVMREIDPLDTCVEGKVDDETVRQLLLADCVFELVGMFDFEDYQREWDMAEKSLAKVWARHLQWRERAHRVFCRDDSTANRDACVGWLDPAMSAEESLFELYRSKHPGCTQSKSIEEIKIHVEEICGLSEEQYSHDMRDYCFHFYLTYLCEEWKNDKHVVRTHPELYPTAIGWVFGKTGARWVRKKGWLLESVLYTLRTLSKNDWLELAEQLFLHARDELKSSEQETLRNILCLPREHARRPDPRKLYDRFERSRRSSVVRLRGIS